MKSIPSFAPLLESFFIQRLMKQRCASPHTIKSYRDTFHLLLVFIRNHLGKQPSELELTEINAPLISEFLDDMEKKRNISPRSRNVRLAAIRSFFRYVAFEAPAQSAQIQRVLAIPSKKHARPVIHYLSKEEIKVLLATPDQYFWSGRRDHAFLLVAVQTGMRLSELTGLKKQDVVFGAGAHIRVIGKGRKERCTPLTKQTAAVLNAWMSEPTRKPDSQVLFPNAQGNRLSADGAQYILNKNLKPAREKCLSLKTKHVTMHSLRHSVAMELLQAGVDRSMIALWLGHESVETTQIYLHANLELKQEILDKTSMPEGKPGCYRPDDRLLSFLKSL